MKNRELFQRDPAVARLMNNGQARIDEGKSQQERQTLYEELSHFVCEGQYKSGMLRILESYLANLGNTSQPAAWVSGFYGSGKSHLLKMLCHLFANTEFPENGATARGLVPSLPSEIAAALKELDTQGRRLGGLHAASGTLPAGGGGSVRLTVLGIFLRSMGLPEAFAQAKFCLYLKNNKFLDRVKEQVEKGGKDFFRELNNLYVSPVLHDALIAADAGFRDRKSVRELLKQEFPQRDDISTSEFIQAIREVLANGGKLPCTAIVLDEVQLYIGDSSERSTQVIEVAEALSKQLDSRILLVGAGQTALSGTPQLQKLRDRFTIPVELSDADVETVTRRILLAKRSDKVKDIKRALDSFAGEISRHLASTSIGPRSEDRNFLVDDYPLLPVRRRFWENAFRAVDIAGTHSQLRTQLRIVYEALREIAEQPLGTVVPADFMFDQLQPGLLQQGVLLREIDETIRRLDDGSEDGRLARRICGLIFLIRKLSREVGTDTGVRATPDMLADLLVGDLGRDGAKFRKEVPRILDGLVESGVLLNVDGEYNLQTRESAEWDKEFRTRQARLNNTDHEIHAKRDAYLREWASEALKGIKLQQGASKEPRKLAIHFGDEAPDISGKDIPVWVRNGWSCSEKDVLSAARAAGADSPVVFVFIPRASADDLKKRIVDYEAARGTIDFKGNPGTDAGREARDAMKTRMDTSGAARDELIAGTVDAAKVFKGGGTEVHHLQLNEKVREAAQDALERLFSQFKVADHKNWSVVISRAKNGDDSPLQTVDWSGASEQHPVCKEILREIGAGKDGRSLRRTFGDNPYGWPQDAVDGALIALHGTGHVLARHKGASLGQGQLDQNKIPVTEFRVETATLTAQDKLKLRGLFQEVGIAARPSDDLAIKARECLTILRSLSDGAGGDPPLPEKPAVILIEDLRALAGNEQLVRILDHHDLLKKEASRWKAAGALTKERLPVWHRLTALLSHARGLAEANDLRTQAEAIRDGRLLLDSTDRGTPLLKKTAEVLRIAVREVYGRFKDRFEEERGRLEDSDVWKRIGEEDRKRILGEEGISSILSINVGSEEELLRSMESTSLSSWREKTDALPQRFSNAAMKAAVLLLPKVRKVAFDRVTLKSTDEVRAWIKEQEARLVNIIKDGPIIIG